MITFIIESFYLLVSQLINFDILGSRQHFDTNRLTVLPQYRIHTRVFLFRNLFLTAYRDGIADGSVRSVGEDLESFYYAAAHALLALCKNLSVERGIVPQDNQTDKLKEVDEMKRVILFYLAAPRADAENI